METKENVVSGSSTTFSNQYETKINNSNDKVFVQDNLFGNLVENLEETSHFDIESIYKKFEEKIVSQSTLIESLSARIKYLEIDSVAKDDEIKKLRREIHGSVLTVPAQENQSNRQFVGSLNSESHRNVQNKPEKTMECRRCRKNFPDYISFSNHVKNKHQYKCKVCHSVFASRKKRRKHLKKHKKEFFCNLCTKKFHLITELGAHFRAKHSGRQRTSNPPQEPPPVVEFIHEIIPYQSPSNKIPPYQLKCKICKVIFDTHSQFNSHARNLHNCKLMCPDCSQIFLQKNSRKKHVKKAHNCQVCNKKVSGESGLISHCQAKHNELSIEAVYSTLRGIQFPTSQIPISVQENELDVLEKGSEEDDNSFNDNHTEEENGESDYDGHTEEENEGSDYDDHTEEENEGSDYDDYSEDEKSDENGCTEEEDDYIEEKNEKI